MSTARRAAAGLAPRAKRQRLAADTASDEAAGSDSPSAAEGGVAKGRNSSSGRGGRGSGGVTSRAPVHAPAPAGHKYDPYGASSDMGRPSSAHSDSDDAMNGGGSGGEYGAGGTGGGGGGDPTVKAQARKQRNRESAALSRLRQKQYTEGLEARVATLNARVAELEGMVSDLQGGRPAAGHYAAPAHVDEPMGDAFAALPVARGRTATSCGSSAGRRPPSTGSTSASGGSSVAGPRSSASGGMETDGDGSVSGDGGLPPRAGRSRGVHASAASMPTTEHAGAWYPPPLAGKAFAGPLHSRSSRQQQYDPSCPAHGMFAATGISARLTGRRRTRDDRDAGGSIDLTAAADGAASDDGDGSTLSVSHRGSVGSSRGLGASSAVSSTGASSAVVTPDGFSATATGRRGGYAAGGNGAARLRSVSGTSSDMAHGDAPAMPAVGYGTSLHLASGGGGVVNDGAGPAIHAAVAAAAAGKDAAAFAYGGVGAGEAASEPSDGVDDGAGGGNAASGHGVSTSTSTSSSRRAMDHDHESAVLVLARGFVRD